MEPWQASVRERLKVEPMEAMKMLMMEMRSFSERPCVLHLGIDTRPKRVFKKLFCKGKSGCEV